MSTHPDTTSPTGEMGGQQLVRATVHLAGAVPIETAHAAHYGAAHVQVRIGSVLLYALDRRAAADLTTAALRAFERGAPALGRGRYDRLPRAIRSSTQEISLIVRLAGRQYLPGSVVVTADAGQEGRPLVTCPIGGIVFVLHSLEALTRLVRVAETANRVAEALWPDQNPDDEVTTTDEYAREWERRHGLR